MKPIAAILSLFVLLSVSEANAGHFFRKGHGRSVVTSASTTSTAGASVGSTTSAQPTAPLYHYSYYVTPPSPPRTYQGYGTNDFPFYGVPYGHPYDPWTWPYMSDAYSRGLARYYDPPVK